MPSAGAAAFELREGVYELPAPLPLRHGGVLAGARLGWRLQGAHDAPVVVALGGISAHRRVFDPDDPRAGWWPELAGPGLALDCRRVRVLGIDFLGGSGTSSGPAPGQAFPSLASADQADALLQLLDHLGVARLRAIVGASYGGMVALAFGERHGARVEQLLVISAADRTHPMATAWRSVQRRIVRSLAALGDPAAGLELARALAMTTYRSPAEFAERFTGPAVRAEGRFEFPVEQYLFARGRAFAARYRPESFLCLSESIDLHAVDATRIACPTRVIAVREDLLVPAADLRALAARLPRGTLFELSSLYGHDAFLKEASQLAPLFECLYGETASES